ncbi:glycosyltransferase family 2 protein [uncultured Polaribacter sp.]|uniref:glycosyltransferase family 2 protein n=1 Tax=uncultured Polaribacter sp. TaxID=174711 RepID=UPI002605687A|nr:glycosyltransferase family 2 protein [uncultured Polaribacter sp.]
MKNNIVVSIIIPTFNRADLISIVLKSIINQTYINWECILIDDGSKDNTEKIITQFIEKDYRFKYFKRPLNMKKGPSSCRNYGLKKAKGIYIQFFDDDDFMYKDMLKVKVETLNEKKIDVTVAPLNYFDFCKKRKIKTNNIKSNKVIEDYISGEISWYVSGPMWKKSFISEFFDEQIHQLDDWDFNLRNIYNKPKVYFLDKPLQNYNIFQSNTEINRVSEINNENKLKSVYLTYEKHFLLLKENNILTYESHLILFKRIIYLLRESLVYKYKISSKIYTFLKNNIPTQFNFRFFKIILGYFFYKFFNKGYRLLKL